MVGEDDHRDGEIDAVSATDALTLAGMEFRVLNVIQAPRLTPRLRTPVRYRLRLEMLGTAGPLSRIIEVDSRTFLNELGEMVSIVFELPQCSSMRIFHNGAEIALDEPTEGIPFPWQIRLDEIVQLPLEFIIQRGDWPCRIFALEQVPAGPIIEQPVLISFEGAPPRGASGPPEHIFAEGEPAVEQIDRLLEQYAPVDAEWLKDEVLEIVHATPFRQELIEMVDLLPTADGAGEAAEILARPWMMMLEAVAEDGVIGTVAHKLVNEFGCYPPLAADIMNSARRLGLITVEPSGATLTEYGELMRGHPQAFLSALCQRGPLETDRVERTYAYLAAIYVGSASLGDGNAWCERQLRGMGMTAGGKHIVELPTMAFFLAALTLESTGDFGYFRLLIVLLLGDPDCPEIAEELRGAGADFF